MAGMANWQAQISIDIDDLKKRIKVAEGELDKIEKKEHKVKLDIDTKTLESAISKLDRMLESLGKGSGDFKEFENLSKQLSSITTDINNISKAFSVMNDGSDFANIIKSIDASLTALSNHFVSEMSGRMTSSIKEVKSTLSDVGDGGELAPLLQTISKIENAINELSTSVKGIGLNMNIDIGSDSEMEAKVQSKIANALQAYQRLFDHIKMSSAGGSVVNNAFFEFDINQYDTMMGKLQAYKKFIENMRNEAKVQYNGKDALYQNTEKSYWIQASAAMAQVTKAFNEMNAASDTNPLTDMFGKTDLSEVISQLGLIVEKLEVISDTASSFKNVFDNGFNVTASVEEITKLTNRVKELEDELSKIKLSPVGADKSNISSPIKDVFQGDDKVNTDASTTSIKEESQALEQVSTSAKDAATSKEKFANANKEVKASADETVISVNKEISALEKAGSKFESQAAGLAIKPDGDHQFLSWTNDLVELNAKIDEYNSKVKYLKENNIVDGEQVREVIKLRDEIEKTIKVMTKTPQTKRGWTDIGASKAAEKVANVLKQNTKMSKEAREAIRAYYDELRSGNPSQPIDEILVKVNKLVQKERELGRVGKSFEEIFKEKVIYGGAAQLAGMVGFYDVINVIRQAGEAVIDLNTNITELAKVSEASVSQIYDDFNSYVDIAKEVGGTISDTISATADWSRNGYNIPDAKELAEVAMIYKNVGDGINIDQANEYLISTLRGFKLEAKDAMDIIDSINEVANNEPISSAGIGEALQRSAAAFNVANTSLQESIALVTSTNSVLQSPEKVGSMWTTVSARIRGAKTELEDAGLETDGMVESTSKLQSLIKGMTGFDILEDDQKTFKSIYDIIIGIGEEFQNLSGVDQAALLEALAGKRQSNALAATLNNIDLLKKAYGEATNAEGSAMAEQEKYQQSIQYSIDRTKASLEELANDFISSDFLKGLIDSGDKLINILDLLIDKFGILGTTAIGAGLLASFKGAGRVKIAYPHSYTYACRNKTLYA